MKHYKYLLLCALAAASAQAAWAQEPEVAPALPVSPQAALGLTPEQRQLKMEAEQRHTPEGMLYQFATAIDDRKLVLAARSVEGGQASADLRRLQARQEKVPHTSRLEITPLFGPIDDAQRELEARVAVTLRADGFLGDDALLQSKTTFIERVTLQRGKSGEWKIVTRQAPPEIAVRYVQDQAQAIEEATHAAQSEDDGFLNTWARAMLRPRDILVRSIAQDSKSNVQQLLLGILQLTQDYDETYAFTTADFQDRLQPYVKSTQIFQAPTLDEDKAFAHRVNPALAGKHLADLDEVAQTVAIFEAGADGKPVFRFGGKALIGFADGHMALVGPEESQALVWKPGPKSIKDS